VANNQDYIARLQVTIEHLHKCGAVWCDSVHVTDIYQGNIVWTGEVQVFDLTGHPHAKRAYAWSYGEPEEVITVLEMPPVKSAEDAVKVGVAYQIKKTRK
jgi:hypothetical protein